MKKFIHATTESSLSFLGSINKIELVVISDDARTQSLKGLPINCVVTPYGEY